MRISFEPQCLQSVKLFLLLDLNAPYLVQHLRKNTYWELVPGKMNKGILELSSKQALFSKWLPRPNHYAHQICIEILCRTPVSILKYLSPRPQNHRTNSKYNFLAWMSTWIFRWRRRRWRRRADNFSIWPDPHPIACRDEISRSGIPHFDHADHLLDEFQLCRCKQFCRMMSSLHGFRTVAFHAYVGPVVAHNTSPCVFRWSRLSTRTSVHF